jgi:hypothetical protein
MRPIHTASRILPLALLAAPAAAQPAMNWYSIACGGGRATSGTLALTGSIAQPDAGSDSTPLTGGSITLVGGFLSITLPRCASDINGDDAVNSQDFFDFITAFFSGDPVADFNRDGAINSQDFFDFLAAFFAGC